MLSKTETGLIEAILLNENAEPRELAKLHLNHAFVGKDNEWHHVNMASMANKLAEHYDANSQPKLANHYRTIAALHESSCQ